MHANQDALFSERNSLLLDLERAREEIAQLDSQLRQLREQRKEEVERQKEELERLLRCIKQEVQRKYHEELRVLG